MVRDFALASRAAVFPISQRWSGYPSIAALSTKPEIDVMCQQQTVAFGAIRQLPKDP